MNRNAERLGATDTVAKNASGLTADEGMVFQFADAAVLVASDRASAITAAVTNVTCGELAD